MYIYYVYNDNNCVSITHDVDRVKHGTMVHLISWLDWKTRYLDGRMDSGQMDEREFDLSMKIIKIDIMIDMIDICEIIFLQINHFLWQIAD